MTEINSLPLFQVDSFADRPFVGNPAAVVPLEAWPSDPLLQSIAAENNLAETAFLVPAGDAHELRWFTPTVEVRLCGHATLAAAYVLVACLGHEAGAVRFDTRFSGRLTVTRDGDGRYWLDLPRHDCEPAAAPASLLEAMGAGPADVRAGPNWLLRFEREADVRALRPEMRLLAALPERGVIATAPGDDDGIDFVSRYFAPNFGVDEDPVTGSAHCMLAPYWAAELGKTALRARQISARGGELWCEPDGERVRVGGHAMLYLTGEIHLPSAANHRGAQRRTE
ncbi:hypothetical protein PC39_10907 [Salinisphaera sp. PC39]|uniref:PhzF family phenazine biosynthesis protein n=1 Tax=Salinisphaera sp. PC39 TaxID=1304156 RepID=UPI0033417B43